MKNAKIREARAILYYPHEDSVCECKYCKAIDCLDEALAAPETKEKPKLCRGCKFYNGAGHCLRDDSENDDGNDVDAYDSACNLFEPKITEQKPDCQSGEFVKECREFMKVIETAHEEEEYDLSTYRKLSKACDLLASQAEQINGLKEQIKACEDLYKTSEREEQQAEQVLDLKAEISMLKIGFIPEGCIDAKKIQDDVKAKTVHIAELEEDLKIANEHTQKLRAENYKLNVILFHRENRLSHPDYSKEIALSKLAEVKAENEKLKKALNDMRFAYMNKDEGMPQFETSALEETEKLIGKFGERPNDQNRP